MKAFFACLLFYCSACIPVLAQVAEASCDTLALAFALLPGLRGHRHGNRRQQRRLWAGSGRCWTRLGDIVAVSVRGSASPEGNTDKNDTLSAMRAAVLSGLFEPAKVKSVEALGTNWTMLRREIEMRHQVEGRSPRHYHKHPGMGGERRPGGRQPQAAP